MAKTTDIVVREHAGYRIYFCGMDHSRDHVHTPRWQDTTTYAWRFASRGDASIIARRHDGRVVAAPRASRCATD